MNSINQKRQFHKLLMPSLFFLLTIFSCQQRQNFDKTKWLEIGDLMTFPNRSFMVDDLVKNYSLKGRTLRDVINLLGQPQYPLGRTMDIGYKIDEDYGSDIDPVYTKTLFIQFNKDSIVKSFEIREWKK